MLKIEAGKFYKTRDGFKVGPMYLKYEKSKHPWGCDTYGYSGVGYRDNGERTFDYREGDIVSEWPDSPVREVAVTRREIVPGTYGKVCVTGGRYRYVSCKSMSTADELREAAHILSQIAEALSDV